MAGIGELALFPLYSLLTFSDAGIDSDTTSAAMMKHFAWDKYENNNKRQHQHYYSIAEASAKYRIGITEKWRSKYERRQRR